MKNITQDISLNGVDVSLCIRREDLLHPHISGNKYRKLKYNLLQAKNQGAQTLVSFGGAFSNHISALAVAAAENGFKSIGIIRGDELESLPLNPTLAFAEKHGMELVFVSRETYRSKSDTGYLNELRLRYGPCYIIPEGGTNELAVKGCEEILTDADADFNYICCAVGTGGTISGIINSSVDSQQVLGFPVLKADLADDVRKYAIKSNWTLINDYHFGGYAKVPTELIHFINDFYKQFKVPLDPIYTGKLLFGVMNMIREGYFDKGSKILAIHTGGLQGTQGMNNTLQNKNLPLIENHD